MVFPKKCSKGTQSLVAPDNFAKKKSLQCPPELSQATEAEDPLIYRNELDYLGGILEKGDQPTVQQSCHQVAMIRTHKPATVFLDRQLLAQPYLFRRLEEYLF